MQLSMLGDDDADNSFFGMFFCIIPMNVARSFLCVFRYQALQPSRLAFGSIARTF